MKPLAIFVSIFLGVVSLGVVVWIGQYNAVGLVKPPVTVNPTPTADDLSLPKSGPYGKAEVDEIKHDFGTKLVGSKDSHTFQIKNVGEGPLQIKLGSPSCQCTVGEISKIDGDQVKQGPFPTGEEVELKPNEIVSILMQWKMRTEAEKFRQHIPIYTTDPQRREIDLEIVGMVESPVRLLPASQWELGELLRNGPSEGRGIAYSPVFSEFTLTDLPRENSALKLSYEPLGEEFLKAKNAKSGYKVTVEVPDAKSIPIGLFREIVQLKIEAPKGDIVMMEADDLAMKKADEKKDKDDKKPVEPLPEQNLPRVNDAGNIEYTLRLAVTARKSGPIDIRGSNFSIETNRVIFGEFKAAEGKKMKLALFPKGISEDLVLSAVEPADTRVKVAIEPGKVLGNTKTYQMTVEIPPGPPGRRHGDNAEVIHLKLNHPEAPDLKMLIDYTAKE